MYRLTRHSMNPIFEPQDNLPWEKEGVFNPGITISNDEIIMLYRAIGERESYISHIGLAKSKDGFSFMRYVKDSDSLSEPVFGPSKEYDIWATEDCRITKIDDNFYITYVAVPDRIMENNHGIDRVMPLETATALLKTSDFLNFEHLGIISPFHSDNKDIVLFPGKTKNPLSVDGAKKYTMLHRPNRWSKAWFQGAYVDKIDVPLPCAIDNLPTLPSMWIAWSNDLVLWSEHQLLLSPAHDGDAKNGPGLPPIETADGWLVIYHHVENTDNPSNFIYSTRVMLLDLDDPTRIIGKLPYNILTPEEPFEKIGGSHIVFPTGGFIKDDTLFVYYGASDLTIGLAIGSASELLQELKEAGIQGKTRHEAA